MNRLALLLAGVLALAPPAAARPPRLFDPTLDPAFELDRARAVAVRTHRRVLLDLGGDWCAWCLVLDRALHTDPRLKRALDRGYVLVHVNVSSENMNAGFLSRYPKVTGYPYLIVVSSEDGSTVHAQDGAPFQRGAKAAEGYDHAQIAAFLQRWAPPT